MLARLLPVVSDVSVTNVCNAAYDFCGFARDKMPVGPRRYIDPDASAQALPILRRRGIRYITLQRYEPLGHPHIVRLVAEVAAASMQAAIITNGRFLLRDFGSLIAAGLKSLITSVDSADLAVHEHNRGASRATTLPTACWLQKSPQETR
jgi:molybdenum cofactor biosynthesis enzyme MoaA